MYIINLTEPTAILIALCITVLSILLGKEFKKSFIPAICLFLFLALILIHLFQLTILTEEYYKVMITKSLSIDAIMIFLSYISYLWVDDIEAKEKNKKSIDNSLEWFWKKV